MLRNCLWLTLVVLLALLVIGGVIGPARGLNGVLAASVAAGLCWFGSTVALVIAGISGRTNHAVQGHLLGTFFRLGLPLVAGIVFQRFGGPLTEAGVFGLIVVFYLITLVAETFLALRFIKRPENVTRAR
jgi:hypothetical protein